MNYLDFIILGILSVSIIIGATLGIVRLIFYSLGMFLGAIAASYLKPFLPVGGWLLAGAVILIWIAISFSFGIIGRIIQKQVSKIGVSCLDRIWGAVILTIFTAFALLVVLSYASVLIPGSSVIIYSSPLAQFLSDTIGKISYVTHLNL
ncbi:MAG: hypothetical protein APR63_13280 [Desulfuromonas sp. SDB]|nr:MAG: hypothetical protein APR63_13280 [Desulfuromonas sp. SDB]